MCDRTLVSTVMTTHGGSVVRCLDSTCHLWAYYLSPNRKGLYVPKQTILYNPIQRLLVASITSDQGPKWPEVSEWSYRVSSLYPRDNNKTVLGKYFLNEFMTVWTKDSILTDIWVIELVLDNSECNLYPRLSTWNYEIRVPYCSGGDLILKTP